MNRTSTLVGLVWGLTIAAACPGAAAGTPAPAQPARSPAATAPARDAVVATVGTARITRPRLDGALSGLPLALPLNRRVAARRQLLGGLIVAELVHAYLDASNVPCDANQLAEMKGKLAAAAARQKLTVEQAMARAGLTQRGLEDQVRLAHLAREVATQEKTDAFIRAHPSCFNGTKVQASHVLIACEPSAPTVEQKAARARLEKIAASIQAGKTTFAGAAKQHSACPSGKRSSGDLGEFAFASMVPAFATKAFSMKVGQTSDIVRTRFGFHLIRVTKRTEGKDKPGAKAQETARRVLLSRIEGRVFEQALGACPIVVHEK